MPRLQFRLLGPLEVVRGSGVLDLGGPKQRAVLGALLLRPNRVVPWDRLIDELWGDEPPPAATSSLQAYVSNLRRALEPDRRPRTPAQVIVTRPPGYLLRVDPNDIDAARFEARAADGRRLLADGRAEVAREALAEALAMWRGPALADLAHEAFAAAERARLEELRLATIEDRLQADLLLGNHGAVVAEAEALVVEHPYRERLWRCLMLALYRAGRQSHALEAYQTVRRILAEELGIDPSPELQRLEGEILRQDPALEWRSPTRQASSPEPVPPTAPPDEPEVEPPDGRPLLVGRDRPLGRLRMALGQAMQGKGQLILVSGEPGIGKTRLVEEVAEEANRRGSLVAWGRCVEGEASLTFWPWTQPLRRLAVTPQGAAVLPTLRDDLVEILPELASDGLREDLPWKDPVAAQARLNDAAARFLARVSAVRPVVVVLDDLQWADTPSLGLLQFLVTQISDMAVLLLGTFRDVDLPAEAPLAQTLGALVREPAVVRLSLRRLTEADVGRFLREATGQSPTAELVAAVHRRTAGNPFFLSELVRLLESEAPGQDWTALTRAVPTGVRDVIRRRLGRLPEKAVLLVTTAAVVGREFDLPLLEAVTGLSGDAALEAIEAALITGLIRESEQRTEGYHFSHDLVRESLSAEVSASRRVRLHATIAQALERLHRIDRPEHVAELAKHMWEGARHLPPRRVAHALLRNAEQMITQLDYQQARVQLDRAAALVDSLPSAEERDDLAFKVQLRIGLIQMLTSGYAAPEAGRAFDRARQVLQGAAATGPEILATLWGSWAFNSGRCDFDAALDIAQELLDLGRRRSEPTPTMVGHQAAGIVLLHTGRLGQAARHLSASFRLADAGVEPALLALLQSDPRVVSRAALAVTQGLRGRRAEADRLSREAVELAHALDHPFTIVLARSHAARHAVLYRDADRALQHSRAMRRLAARHGYAQFVAGSGFIEGWALAQSGRAREGVTKTRAAVEAFTSIGGRISFHFFLGLVAETELSAGHLDQALAATARGLEVSRSSGERFYEPELHRLLGETLLRLGPGRAKEAEASFRLALTTARDLGASVLQERALASVRGLEALRSGKLHRPL